MESSGQYEVNKISLCRGSDCCPQLIVNRDEFTITDDNGGSVTLDRENMDLLVQNYLDNQKLRERSSNVLKVSEKLPSNTLKVSEILRGDRSNE